MKAKQNEPERRTRRAGVTGSRGGEERRLETVANAESQPDENRKCQKYLTVKFILDCTAAERTARYSCYMCECFFFSSFLLSANRREKNMKNKKENRKVKMNKYEMKSSAVEHCAYNIAEQFFAVALLFPFWETIHSHVGERLAAA